MAEPTERVVLWVDGQPTFRVPEWYAEQQRELAALNKRTLLAAPRVRLEATRA